jgi:hypothetical protein
VRKLQSRKLFLITIVVDRIHCIHIGCIKGAREAVLYPVISADIQKIVGDCDIDQQGSGINGRVRRICCPPTSDAAPSHSWDSPTLSLSFVVHRPLPGRRRVPDVDARQSMPGVLLQRQRAKATTISCRTFRIRTNTFSDTTY